MAILDYARLLEEEECQELAALMTTAQPTLPLEKAIFALLFYSLSFWSCFVVLMADMTFSEQDQHQMHQLPYSQELHHTVNFGVVYTVYTFASVIAVFLFRIYSFSVFSIVKETQLLKKVQKLLIYWWNYYCVISWRYPPLPPPISGLFPSSSYSIGFCWNKKLAPVFYMFWI